MQQDPLQLDYGEEPPARRVRGLRSIVALAVLGTAIYGLRKLETMPYRPPYDTSTFLGGRELEYARFLIVLLSIAWCAIFFRFAVSLVWRRRTA
jgi:hypothetical protein